MKRITLPPAASVTLNMDTSSSCGACGDSHNEESSYRGLNLFDGLVTALEKVDKELMMSAQETTANTTNIPRVEVSCLRVAFYEMYQFRLPPPALLPREYSGLRQQALGRSGPTHTREAALDSR